MGIMKSHYIDSLIVVNWAKSLISNIRQISLSSSFYAFIKLSDIITYIFTTFPLLIFILYPSFLWLFIHIPVSSLSPLAMINYLSSCIHIQSYFPFHSIHLPQFFLYLA